MKIGDRFFVSNYFSKQDVGDLVELVDQNTGSRDEPYGVYGAKSLDEYYTTKKIHYFSDHGSMDVMGARIYKTQQEVDAYLKYAQD